MISSLYNRVYLCKPLTSRPSDAEKFIVAQGFKYSESDSKLKDIESRMEKIKNKINENNKLEIVDIFTEYVIDPEMKARIIQFNTLIENKQFKAIGQILTFVAAQNFYGDIYQKAREEQIEAAKFWTELFLMSPAEYKQNKAKINDMSYLSNKINLEGSLELKKILI
jgi:predicted nucleotide-binding protein (sugar kinase/HSP70/actin superfamily)